MRRTRIGTTTKQKVQLKRAGLFFMALGFLGTFIVQTAPSSALPAAKYRYRSSQCSRTDSECMKYSAEGGVYRLYRGILNRNPDNGGMGYWAPRLQNGTSLTDAANGLLSSSEWRNAYQHLNNQQFVNQTYQFALKRSPDASGYNYWLGRLNGGTSKAQMVGTIVNSTESANAWHGSFMATYYPTPPPPPAPNPQPPAPAPSPAPSRPSNPAPSRTPSARVPAASEPSASGQQITELTVSEQNYRSALITWKTAKSSTSKINFSTNKDDLSNETLKEEPTTTHSVRLEGEPMLAGRHYYFRVTADDGSGPVTVDGEFDTKAVAVIVKVTDEQDAGLTEADVITGDQEHTTDENGEVQLDMPEGEQTIYAQKGDLSRELSANIEVPQDENSVQRITLSLSKSAPRTETAKPTAVTKSTPWLLIILVIFGTGGLIIGFLLWRKRNQRKAASEYFGDPLEAENYNQQVLPSTPPDQLPPEPEPTAPLAPPPSEPQNQPEEPQYIPLTDPNIPHHASLPELVGRYGAPEEVGATGPTMPTVPTTEVEPQPSANELSPSGQPLPHHTSLKDLVEMPAAASSVKTEPDPDIQDLPSSPIELNRTKDSDKKEPGISGRHPHKDDNTALTIPH